MEHKFQVELTVTEARGMAVSKYQGVKGKAIVTVRDADGGCFDHGIPNAEIGLSVTDISACAGDGTPMDLQQYLGEVLGREELVRLDGWKYVREIKEKVAAATVTAEFSGAGTGTPPDHVVASVSATGRGLASIAFKGLKATLTGSRVLGA